MRYERIGTVQSEPDNRIDATRTARAPAPDTPGRALFSFWRCSGCGRVLGQVKDRTVVWKYGVERMEATLPAKRYCRSCKRWEWAA